LASEECESVRIAGWILLIGGLVLCLSVVWAALGFLLMGIGLLALQLDERNRRKVQKTAAVDAERLDLAAEPAPAPYPAEDPVARAEGSTQPAPAPLPRPDVTPRADPATSSYDKEAWRQLVENDPDLAKLAAVLADYGQQYVDEFATSYLVAPDKARIVAIVDEIVARTRQKDRARMARRSQERRSSSDSTREPGRSDLRTASKRDPVKLEARKAVVEPAAEAGVRPTDEAISPPVHSASDEMRPDPPKPDQEGGVARITSADDDLTQLIKLSAPDSSLPRKS
jgi:hypothetical protein